jgi:hypothetical protein
MNVLLTFAGNVLFPRLSHRLRWRDRLGARGTAIYVVAQVGFIVAFILGVSRLGRAQERIRAEVREQLGREPTPEEVFEYLQARDSSD